MASGIRPWASQIAEAIEGWERWPDLYRKLVIAQKKALAAHQKPRKQLHGVMPGRRRIPVRLCLAWMDIPPSEGYSRLKSVHGALRRSVLKQQKPKLWGPLDRGHTELKDYMADFLKSRVMDAYTRCKPS